MWCWVDWYFPSCWVSFGRHSIPILYRHIPLYKSYGLFFVNFRNLYKGRTTLCGAEPRAVILPQNQKFNQLFKHYRRISGENRPDGAFSILLVICPFFCIYSSFVVFLPQFFHQKMLFWMLKRALFLTCFLDHFWTNLSMD